MTPLQPTNFRLESELLEALQQVRERDGIPISEQVRRAIRIWLKEKGATVKAERKRGAPRRRPEPVNPYQRSSELHASIEAPRQRARQPDVHKGVPPMRAAIYARVSTLDQQPENQLTSCDATSRREAGRPGVSGAKDRRPALNRLTVITASSQRLARPSSPGRELPRESPACRSSPRDNWTHRSGLPARRSSPTQGGRSRVVSTSSDRRS